MSSLVEVVLSLARLKEYLLSAIKEESSSNQESIGSCSNQSIILVDCSVTSTTATDCSSQICGAGLETEKMCHRPIDIVPKVKNDSEKVSMLAADHGHAILLLVQQMRPKLRK